MNEAEQLFKRTFSWINAYKKQIFLLNLPTRSLYWGSRSFGAKNNDPLEVFVFTSFSYLWELERSGR
jgi:hypothetical protein